MSRSRSLVALSVVITAVGVAAATSAVAAPAERQAWTRTSPVTTFSAQADRIYVAITAGSEEARAFVEVRAEDLRPGATLRLTPGDDSLTSLTTPTVVACVGLTTLPADGELDGLETPVVDCDAESPLEPQSDGTWAVDLSGFPSTRDSVNRAVVALLARPGSPPLSTFRLSFDVTRTEVLSADTMPQPAVATPPDAEAATPDVLSLPLPLAPVSPSAIPDVEPPVAPHVVEPPSPSATVPRGQLPISTEQVDRPAAVPVLLGALLLMAVVLVATPLRRRIAVPTAAVEGPGPPVVGVAVVSLLAVLPMFASELTIYKVGLVLIFVIAAIGLHVLVNWAGQLSLAHAGMVGLPAFVVISLSEAHDVSPLYLLPVGVVSGALFGALVGLPTLRARGLQVALVTLAAGIATDRFLFTRSWLVGAAGGRAASAVRLGPFELGSSRSLYPVLLVVTAAVAVATWTLLHSKLARAWFWVRSNPDAASAFGVPVVRHRVAAFAVGGAYAGLAGALTVVWVQRLTAQAFPTGVSFTYLLVVVLSGAGFLGGIAAAAVAVEGGRLFSSGAGTAVAYAGPLALILVITRYGSGLNGAGRKLMENVRRQAGRGEPRTAERVSWGVIGGVASIVCGFVAIGLAWYQAGNTDEVWVQNQVLVSGGIGGMGLVLLGGVLLIRDRIGQANEDLARRIEAALLGANGIRDVSEIGTATASASDNGHPADQPRARRTPIVAG